MGAPYASAEHAQATSAAAAAAIFQIAGFIEFGILDYAIRLVPAMQTLRSWHEFIA
ncbi:hypothetical protein [Paracoccus seriniphilus]|uniref:hypothetical protein n=1 Tax=Paracoccus seriniphilus TaxID=184748 RepID=UPI0015C69693|nr:hypothetical protein [Paracoccus seriniphilus]WCR15398.1 hypothetical protein JHW44_15445 [Paracoccus seriniphilus]